MNLIVDADQQDPANSQPPTGLVAWITARVDAWRQHRDSNHKAKWDEYYRIWRGRWDASDSTRKTERARIMVPATMQAVDSTVAEIEEATFGREQWFDLDEDVLESVDPAQKQEMIRARDRLLEKMEKYGVPTEISKALLNGAIYGTGIAKIITTTKKVGASEEVCVEAIAIEPYQFIPDPTTDKIDEMLGCAHETTMPMHRVRQMMNDGIYRKVDIGAYAGPNALGTDRTQDQYTVPNADVVLITEYHGLVPASLLLAEQTRKPGDEVLLEPTEDADLDLVEAIVTIGNGGTLLSAKPNPVNDDDRAFVAYQHDAVPGYFWGRGVVEKAYHPQKALDATVRARLDAQGLVANPMLAGDITRLPRGYNLGVWPGKFWATTGAPNEVLQGLSLGNVNPTLFENAADMERMVQTATGAMDPAAGFNQGITGATDRALASSAFIKRSRRAMQAIERSFMRPLVNKIYKRYAQFEASFPKDYNFRIRGTLGIMAREFEQQQLTQMLSLVPNDSKPFFAITQAIIDNSSTPQKAEISKAIEEWVNPPANPEAQKMQQQMLQMQMQMQQAELAEKMAKAEKAKAEAEYAKARASKTKVEAQYMDEDMADEQIKNAIELREVEAFEAQNQLAKVMAGLRAVELSIKAMEAKAKVAKINADAREIKAGAVE